jgi:hypothetical protein
VSLPRERPCACHPLVAAAGWCPPLRLRARVRLASPSFASQLLTEEEDLFRHARFTEILGLLVLCAVLGLGSSLASAKPVAPIEAHAARGCSVGTGRGYGYSYLTSLKVFRTSCSTGRALAKRHGHKPGWSCRRIRLDTSPVQYDDRVTCLSGQRKVVWTYTQNT